MVARGGDVLIREMLLFCINCVPGPLRSAWLSAGKEDCP